jgi:hypothetical protein
MYIIIIVIIIIIIIIIIIGKGEALMNMISIFCE